MATKPEYRALVKGIPTSQGVAANTVFLSLSGTTEEPGNVPYAMLLSAIQASLSIGASTKGITELVAETTAIDFAAYTGEDSYPTVNDYILTYSVIPDTASPILTVVDITKRVDGFDITVTGTGQIDWKAEAI